MVADASDPSGAATDAGMPALASAELGESSLLDQLHDLHRRLAAVRQDSQRYNSTSRNLGPIPMASDSNKIIVCSLHRCVRMVKTSQDDSWQYVPSDSGFKSAIDYLSTGNNVQWITWPGAVVDDSSQDGVRRKLESEYNCRPVFLTSEMLDLFHNQFCTEIMWPLFHSLPQRSDSRLLESFADKYESYCAANQQFLDAVSEVYKDGDLVLVADYQLMNLPGLLRRRFPDITCGFYFHSPFPSSEFFQMLPSREALLHGVLGADLVLFNHFDYVRHFLNVCTRMLGLESSPSRVEYNGRLISLGVCPMGIDPRKFEPTPRVQELAEQLARQHAGLRIIVGVAKLDVCKGVPEMLEAMEHLLEHYPEHRGRVVLFAVARAAGPAASQPHRQLRRQVDELVGRVNGRFGTAEYVPVRYVQRAVARDELVALYASADVALVSSVKEGSSLPALEFVAAQRDAARGVLVCSEFAGGAASLQGALLVNPLHMEQVAASVDSALRMGATAKRLRLHQLARYVGTYTAALWARRTMSALTAAAAAAQEHNRLEKLDTAQLLGSYERSRRRLFLLDYDGTLVHFQSMAELAGPPPALLACLEELAGDPHNSVYVISGRHKARLQEWFGHLARVGLAAEHGYWFRPAAKHPLSQFKAAEELAEAAAALEPRASSTAATAGSAGGGDGAQSLGGFDVDDDVDIDGASCSAGGSDGLELARAAGGGGERLERVPWQCMLSDVELEWRDEVERILEHFTERTPGSLLEAKDCSYTWHFRDADPEFGLKQAKDLQLHFEQTLRDRPVGVVMCRIKKYVTVRPWRVNKGRAVRRVLEYEGEAPLALDADFILAVGDERTDEDMFDAVQGGSCYTCTVGMKVSRAQYYLDDPDDVLRVLTAMNSLQADRQAP